jgi:tetratricopeptide (TPR) repeat protein
MDGRGRDERPGVPGASGAVKRLSGWKAIGQFLGCTERTARRWEADRKMPVHRVPGRSRNSVWASPDELTRWLNALPVDEQADIRSEARTDAPLPAVTSGSDLATPEMPSAVIVAAASSSHRRFRWWALGVSAVLVLGAASRWLWTEGPRRSAAGASPAAVPYDDDPSAREEYRNARFELVTRTATSLEAATTAFRHLTERYPDRAAGWSGLADAYLLSREFGSVAEAQAYAVAAQAARTAIVLDPKSAEAWLDIGFVSFWGDGDIKTGLKAFETGLQLNPDLARGWLWYGNALAATRRFDDALRALARARALDPESRAVVADESWTLFVAGRRDLGLGTMERLVRIDPKFVSWHAYLQRCYLVLGRDEDFLREALTTAELRGKADAATRLAPVAEHYRTGGRAAMLDQLTGDAIEAWQTGRGSAVDVAAYRAQAQDRAGVLQWLRVASAQHDHALMNVAAAPEFESYWDDPEVRPLALFEN